MIIDISVLQNHSYNTKEFKILNYIPAIYFLFERDQLVYIGKTNTLRQRLVSIYSTKKNWKVDSFRYYPVNLPNLALFGLEIENIRHYKPKYNVVGNKEKKNKLLDFVYSRSSDPLPV